MTDDAPDTLRYVSNSATILLVEDDEPLGRSLVRFITAAGFQVVHAKNGVDAFENLMAQSFDAVLSDLNLPDACGVDVLKFARAHDADVPLVLMSGCPTIDTTIEAVNLGVVEYLLKPMTSERLANVLMRATRRRRGKVRARAHQVEEASPPSSGLPLTRLSSEFAELDAKG